MRIRIVFVFMNRARSIGRVRPLSPASRDDHGRRASAGSLARGGGGVVRASAAVASTIARPITLFRSPMSVARLKSRGLVPSKISFHSPARTARCGRAPVTVRGWSIAVQSLIFGLRSPVSGLQSLVRGPLVVASGPPSNLLPPPVQLFGATAEFQDGHELGVRSAPTARGQFRRSDPQEEWERSWFPPVHAG